MQIRIKHSHLRNRQTEVGFEPERKANSAKPQPNWRMHQREHLIINSRVESIQIRTWKQLVTILIELIA